MGLLATTAAASLVLVALPGTARPAFPGSNGKIAFATSAAVARSGLAPRRPRLGRPPALPLKEAARRGTEGVPQDDGGEEARLLQEAPGRQAAQGVRKEAASTAERVGYVISSGAREGASELGVRDRRVGFFGFEWREAAAWSCRCCTCCFSVLWR